MKSQKRWKYKVVKMNPGLMGTRPDKLEQELCTLGARGWELISVGETVTIRGEILIFKRPE